MEDSSPKSKEEGPRCRFNDSHGDGECIKEREERSCGVEVGRGGEFGGEEMLEKTRIWRV